MFWLGEIANRLRDSLPFDVIHRVVVHTSFTSNRKHLHDVWMSKRRGRLRFIPEALQLTLVEHRRERENLESDSTFQ